MWNLGDLPMSERLSDQQIEKLAASAEKGHGCAVMDQLASIPFAEQVQALRRMQAVDDANVQKGTAFNDTVFNEVKKGDFLHEPNKKAAQDSLKISKLYSNSNASIERPLFQSINDPNSPKPIMRCED
jgi:hypothetical protein